MILDLHLTMQPVSTTTCVVCLIQGYCGIYSIYLNMIKFVTDFRHIGGFLLVFQCPQQTTEMLLFIQLMTFCLHTPSMLIF